MTGGGGFLGSALVAFARGRGLPVRSLSRRYYPHLAKARSRADPGRRLRGRRRSTKAVEGCQTVFHTAAKAGLWGPEREYERVNVQGTTNVIDACRRLGARRIIFTSSPSVVFNGRAMEGADETAPYPEPVRCRAIRRTKALAEQLIIASNGKDLAAVSIRPHLIWGPGDNNLLPRIISRARSGRLRRIGDGEPRIDPIYIDNAAEAHFLAADKLEPGSSDRGQDLLRHAGRDHSPLDDDRSAAGCRRAGAGAAIDQAPGGDCHGGAARAGLLAVAAKLPSRR